ncbi:hypothetical protein [Krasilnikovia sp. MM14-A1259]|uniref:hypothetical protein n=1 Tax=Krasilnikovia sp. MM14-A1259 TaxID=3373539 RepID=UPI0038050446
MSIFGRRKPNYRKLAKLVQEGREKGFLADAMAILPPEVRKAMNEAERRAARKGGR